MLPFLCGFIAGALVVGTAYSGVITLIGNGYITPRKQRRSPTASAEPPQGLPTLFTLCDVDPATGNEGRHLGLTISTHALRTEEDFIAAGADLGRDLWLAASGRSKEIPAFRPLAATTSEKAGA